MNTKRIGNSTELNCIASLYDCGCEILLPYGDSQKYDVVIDYKGNFYKVQCKNANPTYQGDGSIDYITFKTAWESGRKSRTSKHYTKQDIDFFATYFEGTCYLIPVEETPSRIKTLRFALPKNGQTQGISLARNYIVADILSKL